MLDAYRQATGFNDGDAPSEDEINLRAQIKAAADDGIGSFLLWNAGCTYQGGALVVDPALPETKD